MPGVCATPCRRRRVRRDHDHRDAGGHRVGRARPARRLPARCRPAPRLQQASWPCACSEPGSAPVTACAATGRVWSCHRRVRTRDLGPRPVWQAARAVRATSLRRAAHRHRPAALCHARPPAARARPRRRGARNPAGRAPVHHPRRGHRREGGAVRCARRPVTPGGRAGPHPCNQRRLAEGEVAGAAVGPRACAGAVRPGRGRAGGALARRPAACE
jgi:hypothetical protein